MSKDPTYNEAITEIEEILQKIESGELDVDELTEKVKRVAYLLETCKKKLKTTESEIQKVIDGLEKDEES
ncbi:MAG: exodeoxyribonuclease VII small subunit [Bacteroidales bacterium]|jgi:exodeoxyribonuclease VII small subunit|nr:exodeoxyribonuclease VII small subunit [Bacteroidales bacterium]